MSEAWKTLIYRGNEYPTLEICNKGKIRNAKTKKEYKLFINHSGYYMCNIFLSYDNKKHKRNQLYFIMHEGVADTFIPNPLNLPTINHKDADKLNNDVTNLEWCTPKENSEHASRMGLLPDNVGENNGYAKLTQEQVDEIRSLYVKWSKEFGINALARRFKVHPATIHLIVTGKSWNKNK